MFALHWVCTTHMECGNWPTQGVARRFWLEACEGGELVTLLAGGALDIPFPRGVPGRQPGDASAARGLFA